MTKAEIESLYEEVEKVRAYITSLRDIDTKRHADLSKKLSDAIKTREDYEAGLILETEYNETLDSLLVLISDIEKDKKRVLKIVIQKEVEGLIEKLTRIDKIEDLTSFEQELELLIKEYNSMGVRKEGVPLSGIERIEKEIAKRKYYLIKSKFLAGEDIKKEELKKMIPESYKTYVYSCMEDDIDNFEDIDAREMLKDKVAPSAKDFTDEAERIHDVKLWQHLVIGYQKEYEIITNDEFTEKKYRLAQSDEKEVGNSEVIEVAEVVEEVVEEIKEEIKEEKGETKNKFFSNLLDKFLNRFGGKGKRGKNIPQISAGKDVKSIDMKPVEEIKETVDRMILDETPIDKTENFCNEGIKGLEIPPKITNEEAKLLKDRGVSKEQIQVYNSYIDMVNERNINTIKEIKNAEEKFEKSGFSKQLDQLKEGEVYISSINIIQNGEVYAQGGTAYKKERKDIRVIYYLKNGQINIIKYPDIEAEVKKGTIVKENDFKEKILDKVAYARQAGNSHQRPEKVELQTDSIEKANIINSIGEVSTTIKNRGGLIIYKIPRENINESINNFEEQEAGFKRGVIKTLNKLLNENICRRIGREDDSTFENEALPNETYDAIDQKIYKYADELKNKFPDKHSYIYDQLFNQDRVAQNYRILQVYREKQAEYCVLKNGIIEAEKERKIFEADNANTLERLKRARGKMDRIAQEWNPEEPQNEETKRSNRRDADGIGE